MNPSELNRVYVPKSAMLRKYVASFNVFNYRALSEKAITYYAFPQSGTEVVFFNSANLFIQDNEIEISNDPSADAQILFLGKYLSPLKVTYKSYVQKISIHFTETGVINFFSNYYSNFAKEILQYRPSIDLGIDSDQLFSHKTEKGLAYLESYLLSIYSSNSMPAIEKATEIFKQDTSISIEELAERLNLNKKTFSRQFKKHVGCTTTEFKRITRFKKTARSYFDGAHKNLLDLGHANGYYDASDFYRQIRRNTSYGPKEFFRNVKKIGPKNRMYIFE